MRIKREHGWIEEVDKVCVRESDILINSAFFQTGEDTEKLGKQLLTKGYADLTKYEVR